MLFDYVIVGGGSAGCVLARRLTDDGRTRVCLLEAGGTGSDITVRAQLGIAATVPGLIGHNNWQFQTTPQPGLNGREGYQPRGKCLGGSSAINASLYVRGHQNDYDDWADLGCSGWSWADVAPYFKKSENNQRGSDALHGGDGPLQVANQNAPHPISKAFVRAATELQIPANDDFNGPVQEGAGLYQVTHHHSGDRRGERCSAAAAYLVPVIDRANLSVLTKARVTGIDIEEGRAARVRFLQNGKPRQVEAAREIIVSAGALQSPQILMLSGIGPGHELERHGIPVKTDLPGVGQNLQDHLDVVLNFRSPDRSLVGLGASGLWNMAKAVKPFICNGTGLLTSPLAEAGAFVKSEPGLERPDLQMHFTIGILDNHGRTPHLGYGYSLHVCALRPHSAGEVFLLDGDPLSAPGIDMGYLTDERDMELMIKGARLARQVLASNVFDPYRGEEMYSRDVETDADWAAYIRQYADTIYHPVGTCKMGKDPMAVVDSRLRVHGVKGLRVVDASVMPRLIGGNTNAPTMMIAEKAADMIIKENAVG
ncbi:GMC family oxidoreductase [Roseibium sp. RKSG952]|uniref:GMC family oxidoreductase n=1 Tax=Roseibium sp. RKSG952 TaxID=2529384 RepID=UPI0012BD5444|nr:GMC family oxidoreductase N-terminal domain-containing protein [Roseibium sp. RKSG952]MTI00431.1 glucose-methanol-choline oxidoreductase [Roseibium sp. RKSG952]